jgi:hypothetical protein
MVVSLVVPVSEPPMRILPAFQRIHELARRFQTSERLLVRVSQRAVWFSSLLINWACCLTTPNASSKSRAWSSTGGGDEAIVPARPLLPAHSCVFPPLAPQSTRIPGEMVKGAGECNGGAVKRR